MSLSLALGTTAPPVEAYGLVQLSGQGQRKAHVTLRVHLGHEYQRSDAVAFKRTCGVHSLTGLHSDFASIAGDFFGFVVCWSSCPDFLLGDSRGLGEVFGFFGPLLDHAKSFLQRPGSLLAVGTFEADRVDGNVSMWRHDDFNGSFHCRDLMFLRRRRHRPQELLR